MHCSGCGARLVEGARFCASCGAAVGAPVARPTDWSIVCPSCCQRTTPIPYFARGANMAKGLALMIPFNVVGPFVFFFLRKDRFICEECRSLLPLEAHVPVRAAFSRDGAPLAALGPAGEEALARAEVTHLERHSRKNKRRAWFMGVVAAGFLAGAGGALAEGEEEAAAFLASVGGLSGAAAGASGHRSKRQRELAETKREREETLRLLELARRHQGRLTVTAVAAQLALDFKEAERLLDRMVDGRRVDMQVDAEGRITYVFTELALPPAERT